MQATRDREFGTLPPPVVLEADSVGHAAIPMHQQQPVKRSKSPNPYEDLVVETDGPACRVADATLASPPGYQPAAVLT
jgi:hypothetical protein